MVDYLKLLKRELLQNFGTGVLTFLFIVFVRLVPLVSLLLNESGVPSHYVYKIYEHLGSDNIFHVCVVFVLGGLFGLVVCRYLHKKETVDFYLSQPFKRTTVFAAKYLSFIIIFCLCYGLNLALMLFAYSCLGHSQFFTRALMYGLTGFFNGALGFLLIYSSVVLAGLLTGCILAHIALSSLFMYIVPLTLFLIEISRVIFRNIGRWNIPGRAYEISPLYFADTCDDESLKGMFIMAAVSLGLTAVNFILCKKRRAETAGRVLTFNGEPLRVFLSLVYGLLGGVSAAFLFNGFAVVGETATFTAGFFIVAVISSVIMEIIFNADFGAAFKNKRWLGASVVAGAVLIASLYLGSL